MTVIATASNPLFRVSRMEVDRDGPTYTVDTLRGMKAELGAGHRPVLRHRRRRDPGDLPVEGPRGAVRSGALHRGDAARLRPRGVRRAPAFERAGHHRDEHPRAGDLLDGRAHARARGAARSATWCPKASRATSRRRACTGEPPTSRGGSRSAVACGPTGRAAPPQRPGRHRDRRRPGARRLHRGRAAGETTRRRRVRTTARPPPLGPRRRWPSRCRGRRRR